ncbi:MAG: ABC transporter ATP-binding protein, partial [Acidobacteria bacterium]|nr:ABC transporter ATP-binding protein [Acidobacteriota bacterium]
KLTVMLSSHLLNEVEQLCNRIAIIDRGRLLYEGSLEKLIAAEKLVRLRVDRTEEAYALLSGEESLEVLRNGDRALYVRLTDEQIPHVNARLVARGILVSELTPQRETLEEVFLRLTK